VLSGSGKQARSYLKSIFDEAPDEGQTYLNLEQSRAVLDAATRRDRILLMLDMTDALRPSEEHDEGSSTGWTCRSGSGSWIAQIHPQTRRHFRTQMVDFWTRPTSGTEF